MLSLLEKKVDQPESPAADVTDEDDLGFTLDDITRDLGALTSGQFDDVGYVHGAASEPLRNLAIQLQHNSLNSLKNTIDQSLVISELMSMSAWAYGNASRFTHESETVSKAIEQIAQSAHSIEEMSQTVSAQTEQQNQLLTSSVQSAEAAGQAMGEISNAFKDMEGRLQTLDESIESIDAFAKEIEGISNQTKLLALNATIEAARAGEAGKGFAVVAAEVKSLSEQTQRTTELITQRLSMLTDVMQDLTIAMSAGGSKVREGSTAVHTVISEIGQMSQTIQVSSEGIASMANSLSSQKETIDSIVGNVSEISSLADNNSKDAKITIEGFKKAEAVISERFSSFANFQIPDQEVLRLRSDHMIWKNGLAECLVGLVKANELKEKNWNEEPLGPWYSRVKNPYIRDLKEYKEIENLIVELQKDADTVIEKMAESNFNKAIGAFVEMEETSKKVMSNLTELEKAAAEAENRARRRKDVSIKAKVVSPAGNQKVRVVNISSDGARLANVANINVGDHVQIQMETGQILAGKAVWHQGDKAGIEFNK